LKNTTLSQPLSSPERRVAQPSHMGTTSSGAGSRANSNDTDAHNVFEVSMWQAVNSLLPWKHVINAEVLK